MWRRVWLSWRLVSRSRTRSLRGWAAPCSPCPSRPRFTGSRAAEPFEAAVASGGRDAGAVASGSPLKGSAVQRALAASPAASATLSFGSMVGRSTPRAPNAAPPATTKLRWGGREHGRV
eukprot:6260574-Lingulodinium_polyedra.AAC.1